MLQDSMLSSSFHRAVKELDLEDGKASTLASFEEGGGRRSAMARRKSLQLDSSVRLQEDTKKLEHSEQRKFLAVHCWRGSGEARYAIKKLKTNVRTNPVDLFQGILDFNAEMRYMSSLPTTRILYDFVVSQMGTDSIQISSSSWTVSTIH